MLRNTMTMPLDVSCKLLASVAERQMSYMMLEREQQSKHPSFICCVICSVLCVCSSFLPHFVLSLIIHTELLCGKQPAKFQVCVCFRVPMFFEITDLP